MLARQPNESTRLLADTALLARETEEIGTTISQEVQWQGENIEGSSSNVSFVLVVLLVLYLISYILYLMPYTLLIYFTFSSRWQVSRLSPLERNHLFGN